jgi:hypothetical protein
MPSAIALMVMLMVLILGIRDVRRTLPSRRIPGVRKAAILFATIVLPGAALLVLSFSIFSSEDLSARYPYAWGALVVSLGIIFACGIYAWRHHQSKGAVLGATVLASCSLIPILTYYVLSGIISAVPLALVTAVLLSVSGFVLMVSAIRHL